MTESEIIIQKLNNIEKKLQHVSKQLSELIRQNPELVKRQNEKEQRRNLEQTFGKAPFTKSVNELYPSVRLSHLLHNLSINTVADVIKVLSPYGQDSLINHRNCGNKTWKELETQMLRLGIDTKSWEQLHNSLQN